VGGGFISVKVLSVAQGVLLSAEQCDFRIVFIDLFPRTRYDFTHSSRGGQNMTTAAAKPKTGKSFWDMSKDEKETAFAKAARQARRELHAKGSPYFIGDSRGVYAVYPAGEGFLCQTRIQSMNEGLNQAPPRRSTPIGLT
jgi:hypothetical protein